MTKSKKTKKALLASVLSIMLCVAMLAGTTFAWFTDTAGSDNNRIKSGDLRIGLLGRTQGVEYNADLPYGEISDDDKLFVNTLKWEPGQVHYREIKVVNEGELAAKFSVNLNGDALKFNYRLDPPTGTDQHYTWTERNLTDVIRVAAYNGTFAELVAEVNKLKDEEIDEFSIVDLLGSYFEGSEDDGDEGDTGTNEEDSDTDDGGIETVSEGTGESGMPNPNDWDTYLARVRAEVNDYPDNYKATVSQYLSEMDDAIAEGDETGIEYFKQLIIVEVTSYYNSLKGEAEDEERMLQIFEEAIASLQAHSGETKYTEKDRDVVTVALALYYLGEDMGEPLLELRVPEHFVGTEPGRELVVGTLERKGATKEVKVEVPAPTTETDETTKTETVTVHTDEQVFTLIAFWPEDGENDNEWNLKNGRKASKIGDDKQGEGEPYKGTPKDSLQIEFDILVLATQAPVENDFFDNNYDKDAEWPTLATEESGTSGGSETPVTPEETA